MMEMDKSWRDDGVIKRNRHLLNSGFMADCTFVVGTTEKKKFQCHKLILGQGSVVFYAMFNGDLKEKGDVKVEDIEPQHFRKMLEYIYSDNANLENVETALSVCYAAHKYMINTLTLKCIDFIMKNLHTNTVCRALEFARLIDNDELEDKSLQYLKNNTRYVLKSASFPYAERATLITLLSQDNCNTSEVELFSACVRWAEAQQSGDNVTLRDVLGPEVLSLIRFLTMTAQEFATVVIPSKLLQLQEECDILCRLVTGTGNMPQGFNTNKETRAVLTGPREIIAIQTSCPSLVMRTIHSGNRPNKGWNGLQLSKSYFRFCVNAESFIYGFLLHGLASGDPVEDRFVVNLLQNSELLASAEYEGLMSVGNYVKVDFNNPVLLKANINYNLKIKYANLHNTIYASTHLYQCMYRTTTGVKMNMNYNVTTISQIHIAKIMQ